jgi:hypothetical protein
MYYLLALSKLPKLARPGNQQPRVRKPAICHPDRLRKGNGLCGKCYANKKYHDKPYTERTEQRRGKRYGINLQEQYALQDGRCQCCHEPFPLHDLKVDHDHSSGSTRYLVCQACNVAIGWAENPRTPLALAYLLLNQSVEDRRARGSLGRQGRR